MSAVFNGPNKLIILQFGTTNVNVSEDLYSKWKAWVLEGDNAKYDPAFRVVGGEATVGANSIAGYFFLLNGWRVRPQEANHSLAVDGILIVEGGGDPFVNTIGAFNVRVTNIVPLQAETIQAGISGLTAQESEQLSNINSKVSTEVDANIVKVNNVAVDGSGTSFDPWGPEV